MKLVSAIFNWFGTIANCIIWREVTFTEFVREWKEVPEEKSTSLGNSMESLWFLHLKSLSACHSQKHQRLNPKKWLSTWKWSFAKELKNYRLKLWQNLSNTLIKFNQHLCLNLKTKEFKLELMSGLVTYLTKWVFM